MPTIRAVSAPRVAPAPTHEFRHFSPTSISLLRDGGSILLDGNLNRSVAAHVRLDGAINSKTRGHFFVKEQHFLGKTDAERPMTKSELKDLKTSVSEFMKGARFDKATGTAYSNLMERLDAAIGTRPSKPESNTVSAATKKKLLSATTDALGNNPKWLRSMPLGVRYVRVPLMSEKHPDGFSYTALVPVGALSPTAKALDPNKAKSFFIERTGGFAGLTQYTGPVSIK